MGIVCCALVDSPGTHCTVSEPESSRLPAYVVVYVQSYGFVATVCGNGICESGPVLSRARISKKDDEKALCN